MITAVLCESQRRLRAEEMLRTEQGIAQNLAAALRSRIDAKKTLLSAVIGLFDASETVTPEDYRRFFESLEMADTSSRAIQGVGFIAVIPQSQGSQPDVRFRSGRPGGISLKPGADRPFKTALRYLEPFERLHQDPIGVDRATDPTHLEAMRWSALNGETAITALMPMAPARDLQDERGTTLYRALFVRGHGSPASQEERLSQLRGWAFMALRMAPLIQDALGEIDNPNLPGSGVLIYGGPRPAREALLFDSRQIHGTARPRPPSYIRFRIDNREWLVGVQLKEGPSGALAESTHLGLLGLLGGTISVLGALTCRYLVDNHLAISTALQEAENANRERALATAVFDTSPLAILVTDPDGRILSTNDAFTQISGLSRIEARGKKASLLRSGRHDAEFYRTMWKELLRTGSWKGEIWNRHRHDEIRRDELTIIAVQDDQRTTTHYVGMLQDITDRYTEQEKVKHQAMHDYLTGLPNRALLMEQLSHHIAMARRYRSRVALMFIDMDGFKPVNDVHGHAVGDRLLQLVAQRMLRVLRESDVLCRQGGDEYVLLIPEAPSQEKLVEIARKLRTAVSLPYPELPDGLEVSVSIGIARWPEHGGDGDSLLDAADAAMYRAKHQSPQHIELAVPVERRSEG